MFTLVTGVRPIKVRFLNRVLRLSDKRPLTILIKKKLKKINLRVRILLLKITFLKLLGFLRIIIFYALNDSLLPKVKYIINLC